MKEILHINSYGLYNNLFDNLYKEQLKKGIELKVYEFGAEGTQENAVFVPEELKIKIIRDFNFKQWHRFFFHVKHKKVFSAIQYAIDDFSDYCVVHAHSLFSNGYIALRIKQKYQIPYVVAVRNTDVNDFFKKMLFLRPLGIKILKEAEAIVFLSDSYKDKVLSRYVPASIRRDIEKKSCVIPNGIDEFWFKNLNNSAQILHENKIKLITAGAVNNNKNHSTVIEACKILINLGYSVDYHIIGKVEDKELLEKLISNKFVRYSNPKPKEQLIDEFRDSNIFVMPSHTETFGLVYAEAISQGLPVLYTRGQGFDRQFPEGVVGFSVDDNNPNEIADRIRSIINDYEQLSQNCPRCSYKFKWEDIALSYIDLYKGMIKTED